MTLAFKDGVKLPDPNGPLRPVKLSDGWYVTGEGMTLACEDHADALACVQELKARNPNTKETHQ